MKSSYAAVGVVGLALGGLWHAAGGATPPAAPAARLRVAAPLAHDNLAVYFVHGPDTVDDSRVVTLQEALERKWAVVHETGQVNELVVENLSPDHALFVQSGDIIKGGRQDRMIAADMLVPPGAGRLPVASHCVEQSRWSGRGNEAAGYFAVSDSVAVGNPIKVANANRDQGGVWANVKTNQDKLSRNLGVTVNAAASPTSLQLALENPAVRAKVDDYRAALATGGAERPGVIGAVFVVNGRVTSAEVYGANGLFRKSWPKLLKAAAEEALVEKAAARTPASPTAREVEQFLATSAKPTETSIASEPAPMPEMQTAFMGRSGGTRGVLLHEGGGNTFSNADRIGRVIVEGNSVTRDRVILNPAEALPLVQRLESIPAPARPNANPGEQNQWGTSPQVQTISQNQRRRGLYMPVAGTQPATLSANQVNTSRVETASTLLLESRDAGKNVIHRSYIKK